jgi:N utilization substance protein B
MGIPPQKFREIVVQLLYSQEYGDLERSYVVPFMMKELEVTKRSMNDVLDRVLKVKEKLSEIDILIVSNDYSFERISKVELSIIRLAIYEMLFEESIPPKVSIAEAVRLCRKFGSPESSHFVNAILDHVYKSRLSSS